MDFWDVIFTILNLLLKVAALVALVLIIYVLVKIIGFAGDVDALLSSFARYLAGY